MTFKANEEGDLSFYVNTQHASFSDVAFNEVDSLVLSSLAYLNFEEFPFESVGRTTPVPLIDILRFTPFEKLTANSWLKDGDDVTLFLEAVATSPRYRTLAASCFVSEVSQNIDKQFCAVTFTATAMPPYLAFRGTDGSIVGWKEDFDLAYKDVIASHTTALRYVSGVLSFLPRSMRINIGGHSKGGNLAEFAAACIDEDGFERIDTIFNHDGPSFLHDPSPRFNKPEFQAKRQKTIPESSVFGMILEEQDSHRIVKSNATSVFQHRPLTWLTQNGAFSCKDELNESARLFDESLDGWLRGSTPEQREVFLDTLFTLVKSTNAENWEDFQSSMMKNMPSLLRETRNLDDETKTIIVQTISRLGVQMRGMTKTYLADRISLMLPKRTAKNEPSDRTIGE